MSNTAPVSINGWPIYYEKIGSGPNILLMIPGAIGTGSTDYSDQLSGPYAFDHDQFTLIAIELPVNQLFLLYKVLKLIYLFIYYQTLGYEKFQVFGWSEGSRVALVLAADYPDVVTDLVVLALPTYATEVHNKNMLMTKNIDNWDKTMIDRYLTVYKDRAELQNLWRRHIIFVDNFPQLFPKGICYNKYDSIKCRILLLHGDRVRVWDPLVQLEHVEHLQANLPQTKVHR
ncbi:valacyclovir hydrolase-like [Oppia nitens]|uniref:valacyclovir hydrolase-like n=1 Tax=Oppia nitens TaxID=1686743 RepID=UPI0023D98B10|nr:valacyclovir hydrolase-like [Oppia nitens]